MPLQPLADNLDSGTYAIFEEDSVKYDIYREAICHAIEDLVKIIGEERNIVVYLLGAGRGPLVSIHFHVFFLRHYETKITSLLFLFCGHSYKLIATEPAYENLTVKAPIFYCLFKIYACFFD